MVTVGGGQVEVGFVGVRGDRTSSIKSDSDCCEAGLT